MFLAMRLPPGAQELAQEMAGTETALIQPECGEVVEERHQMRGSASGREGVSTLGGWDGACFPGSFLLLW